MDTRDTHWKHTLILQQDDRNGLIDDGVYKAIVAVASQVRSLVMCRVDRRLEDKRGGAFIKHRILEGRQASRDLVDRALPTNL